MTMFDFVLETLKLLLAHLLSDFLKPRLRRLWAFFGKRCRRRRGTVEEPTSTPHVPPPSLQAGRTHHGSRCHRAEAGASCVSSVAREDQPRGPPDTAISRGGWGGASHPKLPGTDSR